MIITIMGKPGSGKSTVGKLIAKELKYDYFSGGDLRGKIAMERGLTIDELNKIGETERWTDDECDKLIEKMGKEQNNLVLDSRTAWHFVPKSFKVFLDVDLKEAAKRVFKDQRPDEEKASSANELYERMNARMENDNSRYKKWYKIDYLNLKNYDLVIDTTKLSPQETVKRILAEVKKRMN
ncbi:cytidylate kinase family protein [Candidatus Woesearchaeota archaeon]|nr:cytidylate kinase family protein [Candidatus Woesearchaeota archaeon]